MYLYRSKISIIVKEKAYDAHIVDFSFSGLKIKLDTIATFATSSVVTVDLTQLQKLAKKHQLLNLKYKVVRVGADNIFHLQVCNKKTLVICQKFFSLLVKNNAKHFICRPLKEQKQPSVKHLTEVAEESFVNIIFFISKTSGRHKVSFSAIDLADHPLQKIFSLNSDKKNELNYYPIANNQLYERLVTQPLKEIEDSPLVKEAIIYIQVIKDNDQQITINSFLDEDFKSEKAKADFIEKSQLNGSFYALHFRLTSLPKIDLDSIEPETRAISRFAIHLVNKLEEELSAIDAMIEITDRTADVLQSIRIRKI